MAGVTCIGVEKVSIGSVPDLHSRIISTRGDAFTIRRPDGRSHGSRMSMVDEGMASISRIPYLHRRIISTRGDAFAIRRPRDAIDTLTMTAIGEDSCS